MLHHISRLLRGSPLMLAVVLTSTAVAAAQWPNYLEKFDDEAVGFMPNGWVHTGDVSSTAVSNLASTSPGNSFMIEHDGSNPVFFAAQNRYTFTPFNFDANTPTIFYQFDFNVDFIGGGSEGFDFRLWSGVSQIDRGAFRIHKQGATTFVLLSYGGEGIVATLNMDQWYNIRIEFDAINATDGVARWYLDGDLLLTQTWAGFVPDRTQNIHLFDIRELEQSGGTGSRMFIDNFTLAVPEPASATLLLAGVALATCRRRFVL